MKATIFLILIHFLIMPAQALTILIDPGHGGEDEGAKAFIHHKHGKEEIFEKDLNLALAKKIQAKLIDSYPTYLTRSVDRAISLDDRAKLADKVKADLFISVHINSESKSSVHGFETFYLDNHKSKVVRRVEEIENKNVDGKQAEINKILADLVIERMAPQSRKLSSVIHRWIGKKVKKPFRMRDRGVKPGLFYVLAMSKRPAVLLEAGFMSNPKEIKKLLDESYQNKYAEAVASAVNEYIKQHHPKDVPLF